MSISKKDQDLLGKMELRHIGFTVSVIGTKFIVHATRRVLHRYSDEQGTHVEEFEITRMGQDLRQTIDEAIRAVDEARP